MAVALAFLTVIFSNVSKPGMNKYCERFTRIGWDGRPRKPKFCPMNLSEAAHFERRPQRSHRGPLPHYHGPPEAALVGKDPLVPLVSAAIKDKRSGPDPSAEEDDGEKDFQRRSSRRPRPDFSKKDLVDLGPHYSRGQHFDINNEQTREHPLFRLDGKNKPRLFTGS